MVAAKKKAYGKGKKAIGVKKTNYGRTSGRSAALYRQPKLEFKTIDYTYALTGVTTAGTVVTPIASFAFGTGYANQFIGKNIHPVGLDVRYEVVGASSNVFAAADLWNMTRIMVFQWMDSTTPSAGTILQVPTSATSPLSPIAFTNYENINILRDEIFSTFCTCYNSASAYANSNAHTGRWYIKGKKMSDIEMNSTGPAFQKGGIYVFLVSDSGATPNPSVQLYLRLTFLD